MRIYLHIGLPCMGSPQLQNALAEKRERLAQLGYLFPRALGAKNHTRLYMAVSAPDRPEMLRLARGHGSAQRQAALAQELGLALARDIAATQPRALIISCHQLGGWPGPARRVAALAWVFKPIQRRYSGDCPYRCTALGLGALLRRAGVRGARHPLATRSRYGAGRRLVAGGLGLGAAA